MKTMKTENDSEFEYDDYLRFETCDNINCITKCYSTTNIHCTRCNKSNEFAFGTIYHCMTCIGMKYICDDGESDHGFDLCEVCYKIDPTFVKNRHSIAHKFKVVHRNQMIHDCAICNNFYCEECRKTSKVSIQVTDILDDDSENITQCICNSCWNKFA